MSSSTERKDVPESCILRVVRRLRDGWGMLILTILISVYLTGFYHHSSSAEAENNIPEIPEKPKPNEAVPGNTYLLVPSSTEYQDTLPGSVKSMSSTFEQPRGVKTVRDANTLPGAIGLEGSFDDQMEKDAAGTNSSMTGKNETEAVSAPTSSASSAPPDSSDKNDANSKETEVKPEPSPSSKEPNASETAPIGAKDRPSTKKKRKKKRKKKALVLDSESAPSENTDKAGAATRKRKKKTPRKGKGRKGEKAFPHVSSPPSPATEANNSELSNNEGGKKRKQRQKQKDSGDSMSKNFDSVASNTTSRSEEKPSDGGDLSPAYDGPRPMDRKMEELEVPGETGVLDEEAVKGYYGMLVKAYLAPFAEGITRSAFFNILRRRTYSLSPPGSNKGVKTILFQLIKKKLFLMDPYEVMKNSKPFYKTRVNELIWLLSEIAKGGKVPDTEFLVAIHDCVQTVNAHHTYRGAAYKESNPTFTIVSCNFSDNIPIPMWEGDPIRGGLKSWDRKMEAYKSSDKTPWKKKKENAVFRGGNRPSMFFKNKDEADQRCDDAGRSRLNFLGKAHPELFDVSVGGKWCGKKHVMNPLSEADHHVYKYILYAEGNCFWADRLNKQVFGPSAIVKQETPCGQFWEPLLKPMVHYIPTDFFFKDTVERIKWAKEHDDEVRKIVKNANEFAGNFLSEDGIKMYVEVLLNEYTKLLTNKVIQPEKGSRDVTA